MPPSRPPSSPGRGSRSGGRGTTSGRLQTDRTGTASRSQTSNAREGETTDTAAELNEKYCCGYCGRRGGCDNPCSNRYPGLFLKFSNSTTCTSCKNYLNGPLKGVSASECRISCRVPAKKDAYVVGLHAFESVLGSTTGHVHKQCGDLEIPEWVHAIKETSATSTHILDNW